MRAIMRTGSFKLLVLALLAVPGAAAAIVVPLDHSIRVSVTGQAASVIIGNDKVADVSVVDSRTIYISGKSPGQTDVTVLDALGRPLYSSSIEVSSEGPGRISVYHGAARTELSCSPDCAVDRHGKQDSGGGGAAAPAASGAPST